MSRPKAMSDNKDQRAMRFARTGAVIASVSEAIQG